jgi:hypothetical protein
VPLLHLLRLVNSVMYSRYHRLQKCFNWLIRCQLDNRCGGISLKSRSCELVSASPIKQWPGVRTGGSSGLDEIGVMGREFKMASISMTSVLRCSYVNTSVPTTRIR